MNQSRIISKSLVLYGFHKSLKALPHKDQSLGQVKANTSESIVPVAIEDAMDYWLAGQVQIPWPAPCPEH